MIPRYQKIIVAVLLVACCGMGVFLWQLRRHAHEHMLRGEDTAPTQAPQVAPAESATLVVANDADNSLLPQGRSMPLPKDTGARARALIGRLFDLYASRGAAHPVPGGGSAVLGVFLMPVPDATLSTQPDGSNAAPHPPASIKADDSTTPLLAVINLSGSFASTHPSGIQPEMLTILSICGTLHANLPQIAQVRFLVDGQPRATLAGHADLSRTYLTTDSTASAGANQ